MPDKEFPPCQHRIDTKEIEKNLKGEHTEEEYSEFAHNLAKLYDEVIDNARRIRFVMTQLRDGLVGVPKRKGEKD